MAIQQVLFFVSFLFFVTNASDHPHRVDDLPGQPDANFQHYAGHLKINTNKSIFYWFFESETQNAPLLIWQNFGLGCSSIAYGSLLEVGPFIVGQNDDKLIRNPYSWNKISNLLFIDGPVGVGFSYSTNLDDSIHTSNVNASLDTFTFLKLWFEKFPGYKSKDLYLAGESYIGHFGSELAHLILRNNKVTSSAMNLKGILMGNPYLEEDAVFWGIIDFAYGHGIIPDDLWSQLKTKCHEYNISLECINLYNTVNLMYTDINRLNIYKPMCNVSVRDGSSYAPLALCDPCVAYYATQYLNREDVQTALHVNKQIHPYKSCSLLKGQEPIPSHLMLLVQNLTKSGLRIWIYSGNVDGRIPFMSTKYSLNKLGLQVKERWRSWYDNGVYAGKTLTYEGGLTYAVVNGAGHQVPLDAPGPAYYIVNQFLNGKSLAPP